MLGKMLLYSNPVVVNHRPKRAGWQAQAAVVAAGYIQVGWLVGFQAYNRAYLANCSRLAGITYLAAGVMYK